MSGHSHWHSIRHQKGITDVKRGKIFSKISRQITIAAKEGGEDPDANPRLRTAIEHAKVFNMPKDKIERAIKKGAGDFGKEKLESFIIEAFGPHKTTLIIEGITDNKNRSIGEIKKILNSNNAKIAQEGSIKWLFQRKGVIIINIENQSSEIQRQNMELEAIEAGAEDIVLNNNHLNIYTKPEELDKIKNNLREKGIKIESAMLSWLAKETIELSEEEKTSCQKLFEALDESESVQEIYSNINSI